VAVVICFKVEARPMHSWTSNMNSHNNCIWFSGQLNPKPLDGEAVIPTTHVSV